MHLLHNKDRNERYKVRYHTGYGVETWRNIRLDKENVPYEWNLIFDANYLSLFVIFVLYRLIYQFWSVSPSRESRNVKDSRRNKLSTPMIQYHRSSSRKNSIFKKHDNAALETQMLCYMIRLSSVNNTHVMHRSILHFKLQILWRRINQSFIFLPISSTLKKNIVNFNKYLVEYCQRNIY